MKEPEEKNQTLDSNQENTPESYRKERYSFKDLLDDLRMEQQEGA